MSGSDDKEEAMVRASTSNFRAISRREVGKGATPTRQIPFTCMGRMGWFNKAEYDRAAVGRGARETFTAAVNPLLGRSDISGAHFQLELDSKAQYIGHWL
jgi:hypothetical protein